MKPTAAHLMALCIAGAVTPLAAQTVWRCGPDGRSFQATPCADGHRVALRAAPGAEAVAEAHAVAARERETVETLAAERQARYAEAAARGLGPAGIVPRAKPASPKGHHPAGSKKKNKNKKNQGPYEGPWFKPSAAPPRPAG